MKIKPYKKNLLVKLIRKEDKSSIIIPDTVRKDRPYQGKVISVGSEVQRVKKGDFIVFNYALAQFFEGEGELDVNTAKNIIISEDNVYLTYD